MEITSFGITGWLPERAGGSPRPHSSYGHSINHSGCFTWKHASGKYQARWVAARSGRRAGTTAKTLFSWKAGFYLDRLLPQREPAVKAPPRKDVVIVPFDVEVLAAARTPKELHAQQT